MISTGAALSARITLGWLCALCGILPSPVAALRTSTPSMLPVLAAKKAQEDLLSHRDGAKREQYMSILGENPPPIIPQPDTIAVSDDLPAKKPPASFLLDVQVWACHRLGLLSLMADVSFALGDDAMASHCILSITKDVSTLVKLSTVPLSPKVDTSAPPTTFSASSGFSSGRSDDSDMISPVQIMHSDVASPPRPIAKPFMRSPLSRSAPPKSKGVHWTSVYASPDCVTNASVSL